MRLALIRGYDLLARERHFSKGLCVINSKTMHFWLDFLFYVKTVLIHNQASTDTTGLANRLLQRLQYLNQEGFHEAIPSQNLLFTRLKVIVIPSATYIINRQLH